MGVFLETSWTRYPQTDRTHRSDIIIKNKAQLAAEVFTAGASGASTVLCQPRRKVEIRERAAAWWTADNVAQPGVF